MLAESENAAISMDSISNRDSQMSLFEKNLLEKKIQEKMTIGLKNLTNR